ncbi:MAG TPA: flagellar export protein FliJ [Planctomycetaceae bacterium]|nr:flagellar export protein FliJ [Planctomycetaceae bacterium]HIQ20970.1 flagellar export protein FliJ [Planctomycetota bacterium]
MTRFRFQLDTLLRLRRSERDERRAALAQAYRAEEILEHQRRQLEEALQQLGRQCRQAAGPGPVDVERLLDARRYEVVLRSQADQLAQQRRAVEEEIDQRRRALVEADRAVRVLEKLKQRGYERFRREENRREIRLLDEMASRRTVEGTTG